MSVRWSIPVLGILVAVLAGCAGPTYRSGTPAPVEQRGEIPPQSRAARGAEYPDGALGPRPGAPEIRAATPPPQAPIEGSRIERRADQPAPVESRSPSDVAIYAPAKLPSTARPQPSRAVRSLMLRADRQVRDGDYTNAAASLERALRIDAKDALLWNKLAHVRQQQARHQVAEQLAAKSNALALPADLELRRDNWLLIAKAREAAGDRVGAGEARHRAERLDRP